MNDLPMLFSASMVRAILDGSKDQTRRMVKWPRALSPLVPDWDHDRTRVDPGGTIFGPGPYLKVCAYHPDEPRDDDHDTVHRVYCPYGYPENAARLWVRENWQYAPSVTPGMMISGSMSQRHVVYQATCPDAHHPPSWRPSIFLPRWASRITLEIKSVRVERLQDISEADAKAEGVYSWWESVSVDRVSDTLPNPRTLYRQLWESINGRESWAANPWVWAVGFGRSTDVR